MMIPLYFAMLAIGIVNEVIGIVEEMKRKEELKGEGHGKNV